MSVDPAAVAAFLLFAVSVSLSPGPNNLLIAASGSGLGFVRTIPAILGVSVGFLLLLLVGASGGAAFITDHDRLVFVLKVAGSAYLLYLAWKLASSRGALVVPVAGAEGSSSTPTRTVGATGPASGGSAVTGPASAGSAVTGPAPGGPAATGPTTGGPTAATAPDRPAKAGRGWGVGFRHMLLLQFANPKGWAMALSTIVAFRPSFPTGWAGFTLLCVLFTLVNLASNSVWAILGQGIGSLLDRPRRVRVFNIGAGALLAASVVTILV